MGSNNIFTRCSERIVSRNLTLRLGHNPSHEVVAANCQSADKSRQLAFALDIEEVPQTPIAHDIDLERNELSDLHIIMADEARVATIEGRVSDMASDMNGLKEDVTSLKTDVAGMTDKMDKLIQAMTNLNTRQQDMGAGQSQQDTANSPRRNGAETPGYSNETAQNNQASQANMAPSNYANSTNHAARPQRPLNYQASNYALGQNARRLSPEDFINVEMSRDAFNYLESGKGLMPRDMGSAREMIKPYMYLYRDGVSTPRQKLDARQSITATEYIDAMLALLADTRAFHPDDQQDIFHHLRKVARDILERPWHLVRRWTQYVWDSVEAGSITWADRDIIQEERVRICLTGGHTQPSGSNSNTYQIPARRQQGMQEVTCRAYNSRSGCPQRDSHPDGQVFAMHICSYCDSIGRACYHSIRECERRVTHSRNDNQHQFRNRNQGQTYHQYNPYQNNQVPKNGFQAHQ